MTAQDVTAVSEGIFIEEHGARNEDLTEILDVLEQKAREYLGE